MKKSLEQGDEIMSDAFAKKSDELATKTQEAVETGKIVAKLTGWIEHLQELHGEETPNTIKARISELLTELLAKRTEAAAGKPFTQDQLKKISNRVASLEAQLQPSEKISSN